MIDKRLMKEMPQATGYIKKQVIVQWVQLLANICFVFLLAGVIQSLFERTFTTQQAFVSIMIMILMIIIRMLLSKKAAVYSYLASCDVKDTLRTRLYEKLLGFKNAYTDHASTSELVQLSVEGIDQLETYFGRYLPQFFYSMLAPVTLFLILVWMDIKSAVVLLICVPLIPMSIVAVQKFAKKLLSKYWTSYATLGDSFLENLQGLTTLKVYQADEYKNIEMNKEAENFRKITMKVLTMQLNSVSVMDIVAYGGAAIGSIVAMVSYINGSISLFSVICIILLSSEFFIPLRTLGSFFHIAMNGIAASDKIFRILDLPMDTGEKQHLKDGAIDIKVDHVNYSYDEKREVLHDISLEIKANQFIGIAGESGCGKSTLAKLLVGLANNYDGNIAVQGIERKELDDTSFYERIVYVTHQPVIFKGTLSDNLKLANPQATPDELWDVLKKVRLDAFVKEQGGLDMKLVENGNNLSGGQKQRLSLARALLKDSEVYILDEASSNIDVESENAILEVIQNMKDQKTMIMITHRLSNLAACDNIYVMKHGTIMEQGTQSTLIKENGYYAQLYREQEALTGGDDHEGNK